MKRIFYLKKLLFKWKKVVIMSYKIEINNKNFKIGDLVRITDNKFPIKKLFNKIGILVKKDDSARYPFWLLFPFSGGRCPFRLKEIEKVKIK